MRSFGFFQFAPYIMASRTLVGSSSEQIRERRSHLRRNALQVSERCRSWSLHRRAIGRWIRGGALRRWPHALPRRHLLGPIKEDCRPRHRRSTSGRPRVLPWRLRRRAFQGARRRCRLCPPQRGCPRALPQGPLLRSTQQDRRRWHLRAPEAWIVGVGTCILPDDGLELFRAGYAGRFRALVADSSAHRFESRLSSGEALVSSLWRTEDQRRTVGPSWS